MKSMEKFSSKVTGISAVAGYYLLSAVQIFAADRAEAIVDPCSSGAVNTQFSPVCALKAEKFGALLGTVLNMIFIVAIIAALFYLIYGGIKWLISEGDKSAVDAARQHIISAIIGLIIVFLSYFILNVVASFFLGQGIGTLRLPTIIGI